MVDELKRNKNLVETDAYCFVCGNSSLHYDETTGNHYCSVCDDYLSMINGVKNE